MSRVYFHSEDGTAELLGCERAYADGIVTDIAVGLLDLDWNAERLSSLVSSSHYIRHHPERTPGWQSSYTTAFKIGSKGLVTWKGREIDPFDLRLNTAMLVGNGQVRFLARLHGQCEIHGYVQARNRTWLAALIREGRASGLYRSDMGWEEVADLLDNSKPGPVVMGYSVTRGFPSYEHAVESGWIAPVKDDEREEFYDRLGTAAQWGLARKWLKKQHPSLEIAPGRLFPGLGGYRFGNGLTVLDLLAPDYAERLDRALGLVTT
jgi:hypothetical protein